LILWDSLLELSILIPDYQVVIRYFQGVLFLFLKWLKRKNEEKMKKILKKICKIKISPYLCNPFGKRTKRKFIDIIERRNIEVKTKHKKDSL